jgi:ribosomal protein L37AE/L43A
VNRISVNQCAQCGADLIAAAWSEHVTDSCVRNVWSCDACGYQFEDKIFLSAREITDASFRRSAFDFGDSRTGHLKDLWRPKP